MRRYPIKIRGFTFLETILVLILIGIVATYAMSRTRPDGTSLMVQRDILASKIRYAQFMAISGNSDVTWGIRFQRAATSHSYQLLRASGSAATAMPFPDDGQTSHILSGGIIIKSITPNLDGDRLDFDQWGGPGAEDVQIIIGKDDAEISLVINRNTGLMQ